MSQFRYAAALPDWVIPDTSDFTWPKRALFGAALGAGIGLAYCLVMGCDWSRPGLPKPPEPRMRMRASVFADAGRVGIQVKW